MHCETIAGASPVRSSKRSWFVRLREAVEQGIDVSRADHADGLPTVRPLDALRDDRGRVAGAELEALVVRADERADVLPGQPEERGGARADDVARVRRDEELVEAEGAALRGDDRRKARSALGELGAVDGDADAIDELAVLARAADEELVGVALPAELVDDAVADARDLALEAARLLRGEALAHGQADAGRRHDREQAEGQGEARGEAHGGGGYVIADELSSTPRNRSPDPCSARRAGPRGCVRLARECRR